MTSASPPSLSLLDLWQADALQYVSVVEQLVSTWAGQPINLMMDFDRGQDDSTDDDGNPRCSTILAELEQQFDISRQQPLPSQASSEQLAAFTNEFGDYYRCQSTFIFQQASTYEKGLATLMNSIATSPTDPILSASLCPSLGWNAASTHFAECSTVFFALQSTETDQFIETGGGSGAGFQLYCGETVIANLGGGGGGGFFVGNDETGQAQRNYGGGGGGGFQGYSGEVNTINTGLGCGSGDGGGDITNVNLDGNYAELLDETLTEFQQTLRQCVNNGTFAVLGGGGGGGGRTISANATSDPSYCGDGYGFSFYTTPKLILSDNEDGNSDSSGSYFQEAESQCQSEVSSGQDYSYNWTCVCTTTKELAQADEANGKGDVPSYITTMSCDESTTDSDSSTDTTASPVPSPSMPPTDELEDVPETPPQQGDDASSCIAAGTGVPCGDVSECCLGLECRKLVIDGPTVCLERPLDETRPDRLGVANGELYARDRTGGRERKKKLFLRH